MHAWKLLFLLPRLLLYPTRKGTPLSGSEQLRARCAAFWRGEFVSLWDGFSQWAAKCGIAIEGLDKCTHKCGVNSDKFTQ